MPTFLATSAASATFDYCTLAQVKARASIASATTTHDTVIAAAITAASRVIDEDCQRIFYSVSATKYYTPDNALTLFVPDDVLTITTLQTVSSSGSGTRVYGFTWSATDYDLEPADGPPYTRIVVNDTGQYQFPTRRRGALVTGTFGYNSTGSYPDAINEACIRMAARLFERKQRGHDKTDEQEKTWRIEIPVFLAGAGPRGEAKHQQTGDDRRRHVHEKHRAPAKMRGEIAARDRPKRGGADANRRQITLVFSALTRRHNLADQRLRHAHEAAAAQPLDEARRCDHRH